MPAAIRTEPDLSTFGKALGAGFPVGAVAGPRTILDRMRWGSENMVLHYGTFNGHRLTMRVIAANLDLLGADGAVYQQIYTVGDAAVAGLRDIFRRRKIAAIVQGFGPDVSDLLCRIATRSTIIATTVSTRTRPSTRALFMACLIAESI
jgi:glutamate-1-semialdehyde aminotransferase